MSPQTDWVYPVCRDTTERHARRYFAYRLIYMSTLRFVEASHPCFPSDVCGAYRYSAKSFLCPDSSRRLPTAGLVLCGIWNLAWCLFSLLGAAA